MKKCSTSFVIRTGMKNDAVTLENSLVIPQKVKHKITI